MHEEWCRYPYTIYGKVFRSVIRWKNRLCLNSITRLVYWRNIDRAFLSVFNTSIARINSTMSTPLKIQVLLLIGQAKVSGEPRSRLLACTGMLIEIHEIVNALKKIQLRENGHRNTHRSGFINKTNEPRRAPVDNHSHNHGCYKHKKFCKFCIKRGHLRSECFIVAKEPCLKLNQRQAKLWSFRPL